MTKKEGEGKKTIWLTARQHPGETMAEWFMEGFIERLLDEDDGAARALLDKAVIYLPKFQYLEDYLNRLYVIKLNVQ